METHLEQKEIEGQAGFAGTQWAGSASSLPGKAPWSSGVSGSLFESLSLCLAPSCAPAVPALWLIFLGTLSSHRQASPQALQAAGLLSVAQPGGHSDPAPAG